MTANGDNHAIVFSDIVGSSNLYASLGNQRAKHRIDDAIRIMSQVVCTHQGRVVKTIGDEIMCVFADPELACEAAIGLNYELNLHQVYLRTGVCFGKVLQDRGDIYGDTVNNAAFLTQAAQASQILFDSNTYSNLSALRRQAEYFDRIPLKGQSEASLVYRLNWEKRDTASLDATVVAGKAISQDNGLATQLTVTYAGHTYYAHPSTQLCIGRDQGLVQICVQHKNASRKHCSLSFYRGKFILQDHSTNGCYLLQKGHQELFIRRESTPLLSDGKISLGQPCENSETILEYHLE
ncbi:MAG: adenylate cyclase [Lentisphaeria bacterium]|jgi:adenylate cyclase